MLIATSASFGLVIEFPSRANAYGIGTTPPEDERPVHQILTMEGLDVVEEVPEEIVENLGTVDQSNRICAPDQVRYNPGDDLLDGSKEEDEDLSQLLVVECPGTLLEGENCSNTWNVPACGPGNEGCTWTNGFLEHFWNPDLPLAGGFDCGRLSGGYNQGLHDFRGLGPANGDHYDSSYRLAQFYWDHIVLPLYRIGSTSSKRQAYYWLGRVAHLLEDLTVPAHVHDDPHPPGNTDEYEESFKTAAGPNDIYGYRGADYRGEEYRPEALPNLATFDWGQVHPYAQPPSLFKLFWFVAQRTQYAWSDNASGESYYVTLGGQQRTHSPSLWAGAGFSDESVTILASKLVPHALRAVGGLFRLFWEANHPPWVTPPPATITSGEAFSVSWRIVDGETFGHTNVHYDTIQDLRPATCLGRDSCRSTPQQSAGLGVFSANIVAPTVAAPTTFYLAVHGEISTYDVMGEATAVEVLPAATSHAVAITADPVGTPNPVASGGVLSLTVTATDTRGHSLAYAWSASCPDLGSNGVFAGSATRTPTWTAPSNTSGATRYCTLRVVVDDGLGLSQTRTMVHPVSAVAPSHAINVTVPSSGNPNPVLPAARARLVAAASDSLAHPITYSWTASCPDLPSAGTLIGTQSQTPEWIAPQNPTGSERSCTIAVTISDDQGLSVGSSYSHRVSPGGVTSLSISDGLRLVEGPPYPINGKATLDATIENVGAAPVLIDRFQPIGTFSDPFGFVYERTWPADQFTPPLTLAPGGTYRYTRLLGETFPGQASTATVAMHVKFNNVPGQQPISNAKTAATSQVAFEVGHAIDVTNGPSSNSNPLASGGVATMIVNASDTLRHSVTYHWSAACPWATGNGAFSSAVAWQPTWAAPPNLTGSEQTCTIGLEVADGRGASATRTFAQKVSSIPHTLTLVTGPASSADPVESSATTTMTVGAFDSLGHVPSYEWQASCPGVAGDGTFSAPSSASTIWTAPSNLTGVPETCDLTVTVRDGFGAVTAGSVSQTVNSREHEIAVTLLQGDATETVAAGDPIDLAVDGVDSLGHALVYSWVASCPELASNGGLSSTHGRATTWTAPGNPTADVQRCSLTVTVDDGLGLVRAAAVTRAVAPNPTPTSTAMPTRTPKPSATPTPTSTMMPTPSPTKTTPTPTGAVSATPMRTPRVRDDVDGDRVADVAVYESATGNWFAVGSTAGLAALSGFGGPGFSPAPGDYDGDGITDPCIYEVATGLFYDAPSMAIVGAETGTVRVERVAPAESFVPADWLPAQADYDGDGHTDFAAYNRVTGTWWYRRSTDHLVVGATLGGAGFVAIPADFDGDGKSDVAVYQLSNGDWTYIASSTGMQVALGAFGGGRRFTPVPADYDGDGKADQALYQKKKGKWRFKLSTTGLTSNFAGTGGTGWLATPGDFDGDGAANAAVYRKSTGAWRYQRSLDGPKIALPTLGGSGFVPVVGLRP